MSDAAWTPLLGRAGSPRRQGPELIARLSAVLGPGVALSRKTSLDEATRLWATAEPLVLAAEGHGAPPHRWIVPVGAAAEWAPRLAALATALGAGPVYFLCSGWRNLGALQTIPALVLRAGVPLAEQELGGALLALDGTEGVLLERAGEEIRLVAWGARWTAAAAAVLPG